jgi:hypothetical protein
MVKVYHADPYDQVVWDSCDPEVCLLEDAENDDEVQNIIAELTDVAAEQAVPEGADLHLQVVLTRRSGSLESIGMVDTAGEVQQCIARKRRVLRDFLTTLHGMPSIKDRMPFMFAYIEDAEAFGRAIKEGDGERVDALLEVAVLHEGPLPAA